jgi:hypothetical protein
MPTVATKCKIGYARETLPSKHQKALDALLSDRPSVTGGETDNQISDRLYDAGVVVSPNTIGRHRAGTCACFRRR